jgi:uncharacterized protein YjiK
MSGYSQLILATAALAAVFACTSDEKSRLEQKALESRAQRYQTRLAGAETQSGETPVARWIMPPDLREISGLTLTSDGRLLTHDDEVSRIFEVDPKRGVIVKSFMVGNGLKGDFEGMTTVGPDIYLALSNGLLYRFREGANGARVKYATHDTRLGKECEFEGVAYDRDSSWLVLPCKNSMGKVFDEELVLYRWRIGTTDSSGLTMLTVPIRDVVGANNWKKFRTSDITIDPVTRNYVLISSLEKGILVMKPDGEVVSSGPLPDIHQQPEGVAITAEGVLIISDEATGKPAALTLYRWARSAEGGSNR